MDRTGSNRCEAKNHKWYSRSRRKNAYLAVCGTLLVTGLAGVVAVKQGFAGAQHPRSPSTSVRINVRIYNRAWVPAEILRWAENDVSKIFLAADVGTTFVDCPLTEEEVPSYPACQGAAGISDFIVNLLTPSQARHLPASNDDFGLAVFCGPRQAACIAYVNYERTRQLAPIAKIGPSLVLGRVLAHELGHLLGLAHSESGLMRVQWNPRDFGPNSLLGIVFTPWECQRVHAEAVARATEQAQITVKP